MKEDILGLDLGTNSIGWAWVSLDEKNFEGEIIDWGSRIIPSGGDQLSYFKKGQALNGTKNSVSKSASRRGYRSIRRGYFRFRMRRDKLVQVFHVLGWKPFDVPYTIDQVGKYARVVVRPKLKKKEEASKPKGYNFELTEVYKKYEIRNRAVEGILNKDEFASVLYQLNQRRGYQDIGLLGMDAQEGVEEVDRDKLKPGQRKEKLEIVSAEIDRWDSPKKKGGKPKPVYRFTAQTADGQKLSGESKVPYLERSIGKQGEYILRKDKDGSDIIDSRLVKTNWSKGREGNNKSLRGRTVGQVLFQDLQSTVAEGGKHWDVKLKRRVYDREFYKKEFDKIWAKQSQNIPVLANCPKDVLEKIAVILAPDNQEKQQNLMAKGLRWILKEYIIFYQRPLKGGQRKDAADCRFEKPFEVLNEKTGAATKIPVKGAPISHPLYQEFRIWSQINNLKIRNLKNEEVYLSSENYEKLHSLFSSQEDIKTKDILEALYKTQKEDRSKEFKTNYREETNLKGFVTEIRLRKALKSETESYRKDLVDDHRKAHILWHNVQTLGPKRKLRSAKLASKEYKLRDTPNLKSTVRYQFNLNTDSLEALDKIEFEKGYAPLSVKAIRKILPLMRRGKWFDGNQIPDSVKQWIKHFGDTGEFDLIAEKEINEKLQHKIIEKIEDAGVCDISVFEGFRYDEAAELVYGSHVREAIKAHYDKPSDIQLIKRTELRHPIVEQVINEALKVTRDLWIEKGRKPHKIKIELAREFKNNEKRRNAIFKRQTAEKEINDNAKKALIGDKFNKQAPTLSEITRYKLWTEQGGRCAYTGEHISPADLFAELNSKKEGEARFKFQVDHIIPRARTADDSYSNKILVLGSANAAKDHFTARDFMDPEIRKSKHPYDQRLDWDTYLANLKRMDLSPSKREKLMLRTEDIEDGFVERQKKETQYIARRIILELSKIVGSENVETVTGSVTNVLRQEWGINDIFKRKLKDRFLAFETKINRKLSEVGYTGDPVVLVRENERGKLELEGFSKRVDNRHHALDALLVACTTRIHVKYLNDKNQIFQFWQDRKAGKQPGNDNGEATFVEFLERYLQTDERGKNKFRKPWDRFCREVIEKLDKIIVSYRQKVYYKTTNKNYFKVGPVGGKATTKSEVTDVIKGAYHNADAQCLKKVQTGKFMEYPKLYSTLEKMPSAEWSSFFQRNFPTRIAWQLEEIGRNAHGNSIDFKRFLQSHFPKSAKGKTLDKLPLIEYRIGGKVPLQGLTEKLYKTLFDKRLREEIWDHLAEMGGDWEEAFSEAGVLLFNEKRRSAGKMPVYKLNALEGEPYDFDSKGANEIIHRKNSFNPKAVFKKMDTSVTLLYQNGEDTNSRRFVPIKLLDYAKLAEQGNPLDFIEHPSGFDRFCILDTHSMFYNPDEDETLNFNFETTTEQDRNRKLYRLTTFSTDIYFIHHLSSEPLTMKFEQPSVSKKMEVYDFGESRKESPIDIYSGRSIKRWGVPVKVSRTGKVELLEWTMLE